MWRHGANEMPLMTHLETTNMKTNTAYQTTAKEKANGPLPLTTCSGFTLVEGLVMMTIILCLVGLVAIAFVQPVMKSRTYNKLTGANTTWWDAIWVELRVQDTPK